MLKVRKLPNYLWGGLIIFVRMLGGLGMQKYMAVLFGPAGTTLLSHFQNLISLFSQPIQDAVAQGYISAYSHEKYSTKDITTTAFFLTVVIFLLTLATLWFSGAFPTDLFNFTTGTWLLVIASILLITIQSLLSALFIAQKKLKFLVIFSAMQWLSIFGILIASNTTASNTLLLFVVVQGCFTMGLVIFLIFKKVKALRFNLFRIDKPILAHFRQFILMGLTVWITSKWVDFFVRENAMQLFGIEETGLWQAVVRISEAYRGLLISFLFLTFYPVLTQLYRKSSADLSSFFTKYFKKLLGFTLLFFLLLFFLKHWVVLFLYSADYLKATSLFNWQMLGDLLAFLSFPFALLLMATVSTGKYIFCEFVSASVYVASIFLGNHSDIEILVYAHVFRFIVYLILVISFTKKHWSHA